LRNANRIELKLDEIRNRAGLRAANSKLRKAQTLAKMIHGKPIVHPAVDFTPIAKQAGDQGQFAGPAQK
jgi:hypothetical protein